MPRVMSKDEMMVVADGGKYRFVPSADVTRLYAWCPMCAWSFNRERKCGPIGVVRCRGGARKDGKDGYWERVTS